MGKVTATGLRRKYPNPRRACESSGADLEDDYCVAGTLCMEANVGTHFPTDDHIVEALRRLTDDRITCYTMSDRQHEQFHSKIAEMTEANDIGHFDLAWKCLGELLRWQPDGKMLEE